MNDSIQVSSTSQARTSANTLSGDAKFYSELVTELRDAQTQIKTNWEGDSNDIADIVTRIDSVCSDFETRIVPTLNDLSGAIVSLSDEVDATANSTVDSGSVSVGGDSGSSSASSASSGSTTSQEKPDFWTYHANDFKDDWDYSGCDSGLDYLGATLGGICETAGSAVNFVVDGASEILGWLFG